MRESRSRQSLKTVRCSGGVRAQRTAASGRSWVKGDGTVVVHTVAALARQLDGLGVPAVGRHDDLVGERRSC